MKKIPLCALLACLSVMLAVFPARGQGPASVLARVEAVDRVDRLGLPVHAHLLDANGRAYALVVAKEGELARTGWPFAVLARDPDRAALSMAIERIPGALARARQRSDVLYDDGRRLILTPTPAQAAELTRMGLAVIRIGAPLVWPSDPEKTAAALQARRAIAPNAVISNLMAQVHRDTLSNLTAELDGEAPATIGGEPYTILTRGTPSGTPIQQANRFVYEQMQAAGLEVSYHNWSNENYSGQNVVGVKPGATLSNEVVLVTAHIDNMPDDGTRAPGADDNASGCVGVLTAARIFRDCPMDRTVRFICFGGEEQGLLGSAAYAQSIRDAGETNVTVFNMDMISYSTTASREMTIHTRLATDPGYAADLAVATAFQDVLSAYGLDGRLTLAIMADGVPWSDHYSFWQNGYPGVLAIECETNLNPNYHTELDLLSGINMEYFTDFVRAAVGTVGHLAGVPPPPEAPTGVAASDGAYWDKVQVTWNSVTGATSYLVFRSLTNSTNSASQIGASATNTYNDTAATNWPETALYYWVKAVNTNTSAFSAAARGSCALDPALQTPLSGDFDGDRKNDLVLYQASSGIWSFKLSGSDYAVAFIILGGLGYQPIAMDFDGDLKADPGVYDPATGAWAIRLSGSDYNIARLEFGGADYTPVVGDYDGDRKADPALYQQSTGNWFVKLSGSDYGLATLIGFGGPGYTALALDFDGDGKTDPGIYKEATGDWTVQFSGSGYSPAYVTGFGAPGYRLVAGMYDNDARADAAIYNPTNGNWTILLSADAYITGTVWGFGAAGYTPVVGDFDGDGKVDPALYRESTSTWFVKLSGSGYALAQAQQ